MHWPYHAVAALPREVYDVLVDMLNREHRALERDDV